MQEGAGAGRVLCSAVRQENRRKNPDIKPLLSPLDHRRDHATCHHSIGQENRLLPKRKTLGCNR
jgi:hypothetical protein